MINKLTLMLLSAFMPAAALARTSSSVVSPIVPSEEGDEMSVVSCAPADEDTPVALSVNATSLVNSSIVPTDSTLYARSLKKRHIERVNRDDLKATFVPKGQWMCGGTINFQEWDTDNIDMLVMKNMNFEGHAFSISPSVGYFVARNIAVGARYNYSRNYFYLGQFDLNLGEDFNISLADLYYLGHAHKGSIFLRNYMPIGRSRIFGFFSEIAASYAQTTSKNSTGTGVDYDGSFSKVKNIQLGFTPGMTAFFTDFAAAEVSIGVMGLNYKWGDMNTNQVETGSIRSGGANFKFNLLSVNIGIIFYL